MGLMNLFSGKSSEALEQKGDDFFNTGAHGHAKLTYEKALHKLEKKSSEPSRQNNRLKEKIIKSKEALAIEHKQKGEEFIECGYFTDAEDFFRLALELTEKAELTEELNHRLQEIATRHINSSVRESEDEHSQSEDTHALIDENASEEYFNALCNALPATEKALYRNYGRAFKQGYIALNQGAFERAAIKLSQALEAEQEHDSFISLELAIAYLNLEKHEEARLLLDGFLSCHPESPRAYALMCEILWEKKSFEQADTILHSSPPEIRDSLTINLLRGETLYRAQNYTEAESFYVKLLDAHGWDENLALGLAKTYDKNGQIEKARDLYAQLMNKCQGCGKHTDPFIKQGYAENSFKLGDYSTRILELYLALAQENRMNRSHYFKRIIQIYASQGNEKEAERYRNFLNQTEA